MKMSKHYKKLCLVLGLTGILGATAVTAQSGTQNLQATYRNIRVTYNGVTQNIANEPFLVNGSTYVPLRAIGDIFGANATWDPASNTVVLAGGSVTNNSDEITQLNYQIAALQKELSEANAELAQYKANANNSNNSNTSNGSTSGSTITQAQLKETEDYLNKTLYDGLNNVNCAFDLSLSGNQINVTITYDTRTDNNNFKKLSESTIEKFLKRVGDNIAATHKDIAIAGTIEYTNDNQEKASFTRSATGKYTYTHDFDQDTLEELLEEETNNYLDFDGISPSSLAISNYDITIRENKSSVYITLYLDSNKTFDTYWGTDETNPHKNQLTSRERKDAIEYHLTQIQEAIQDATNDYSVSIDVYYNNNNTNTRIASISDNGKISTETYKYTNPQTTTSK